MNILPKKSWHVKNRKNIERVQRDEAEAERLNNIEHDRRMRAEQEARVAELRARAGIADTATASHINLFDKSQEHQTDSNKEHDEEKRQELHRHGIINRLVKAEDVNSPWYCQPKILGNEVAIGKPRSSRITSIYDPLTAIKHAEEIVKAKRLEQKKLELQAANQVCAIKTSTSMIPMVEKQLQVARLQPSPPAIVSAVVEHDSSPEIIKIVKSSKNKLHDRVRDSRGSKKSKKRKKKDKKCKHHHHHHRKHKKHKS